MTEKRDIFAENDLVSATECTGAAPRAMDEDAAEAIADMTNMRCSPSFTAADPSHSPRPGGNGRLSDTRSSRSTKPVNHPAKGWRRFLPGSGRNP